MKGLTLLTDSFPTVAREEETNGGERTWKAKSSLRRGFICYCARGCNFTDQGTWLIKDDASWSRSLEKKFKERSEAKLGVVPGDAVAISLTGRARFEIQDRQPKDHTGRVSHVPDRGHQLRIIVTSSERQSVILNATEKCSNGFHFYDDTRTTAKRIIHPSRNREGRRLDVARVLNTVGGESPTHAAPDR